MMRRGSGPHCDRVVALKRIYGSDNFFQLISNVAPTQPGSGSGRRTLRRRAKRASSSV